jgi:hypothetical protein
VTGGRKASRAQRTAEAAKRYIALFPIAKARWIPKPPTWVRIFTRIIISIFAIFGAVDVAETQWPKMLYRMEELGIFESDFQWRIERGETFEVAFDRGPIHLSQCDELASTPEIGGLVPGATYRVEFQKQSMRWITEGPARNHHVCDYFHTNEPPVTIPKTRPLQINMWGSVLNYNSRGDVLTNVSSAPGQRIGKITLIPQKPPMQ